MSTNKPQTILISPAGGQAIHGIVDYFRGKGYTVIGIDRNPEAIGKFFVDRFIEVPGVLEGHYMDKILEIISEYKVSIFVSWLDPEVIFWNEKFFTLEIPSELAGVFAFNFRRDINEFFDKFSFYYLLQNSGFTYPKTFLLEGNENEILNNINLPVVVKPRIGFGARDTFIFDNAEDLKHKLRIFPKFRGIGKFLIQEYIAGDEYTVDFFAEKGNLVNVAVRKRIEHRGVSLRGEIACNESIEALVSKFCSEFNIDGLNNIQVIQADDKFHIIDFNPRPSGTIMLSVNAGVDFMNNLTERMAKKEITRYGKPRRLKMIRYLCEHYYE